MSHLEDTDYLEGRFSDSDHQLLIGGLLSDCEVVCDGRTWALHKAILGSRSAFFKKCFLDDWAESETHKVSVDEFNAQQMELLITYIYLGKINFLDLQCRSELLRTLVQLWILGDYFLVPTLCQHALDYIWDVVPCITSSRVDGEYHLVPEDWYVAGQMVYGSFPKHTIDHDLKAAFLQVTIVQDHHREAILKMPEFRKLCLEYREFSSDCMIKIAEQEIAILDW
ncbi:POZ domain-containing protein [Colletotrichum zoysiae]|uniref:POZ domain-containing protein n=1 Tax=Colletotrichum zoysiae TaxID=1216348 RepID=A0AAD9M847_9PEZI|nr:POZ domain-containing protein [Colletotrichum zoysiae]